MENRKTVEIVCDVESEQENCDLCGNTWSSEKAKTTVEMSSLEGEGKKTTVYFHVCPQCFVEKLIPFLVAARNGKT